MLEQLLTTARALLENIRASSASLPRSAGQSGELLGSLPDFLNPQSLTRMGAALDKLFGSPESPVFGKLCVVE